MGFFKENTLAAVENDSVFLNRYMVIPSLVMTEMPTTPEDTSFQNILYSLKNWGRIPIHDGQSLQLIRKKVEQMDKKLDLKYIVNESMVSQYVENVSKTMESSEFAIYMMSMILLLLMIAVYFLLYIWKYSKEKYDYAVRLICGCSLNRLKTRMFCGILIQFALALTVAYILGNCSLGVSGYYKSQIMFLSQMMEQMTIIAGALIAVVCLVLNFCINKGNIYRALSKNQ